MFQGLRNDIYLWWWASTKKVKGIQGMSLVREYVTYGKGVTDLTWKIKYRSKKDKKEQARYISERVNDWNLINTIRKIERERLPREIELLKESVTKGKEAAGNPKNTKIE